MLNNSPIEPVSNVRITLSGWSLVAALALAACGGGGGGDDNNNGDDGTPPADNPSISVAKSITDQSTDPVFEDTILQYRVVATNTGDVALSNVRVSDPLISPGTQVCATVPINETCILNGSYTVTAADATAGQVQNTATATSDESATASDTVTIGVNSPNPSVSVEKALTGQSSDPVVEGTVLDYSVTATNNGNITLTGVQVTDALLNPGSRTCASLPVNESCTLTGSYTVTADDVTAGEVENTASADGDQISMTDSNTVTTPVSEPPSGTGLDVRPSNTTCIAPDRPVSAAGYRVERVFAGLGFLLQQPLWMGQPPGDSSRWFVAEKGGRVVSFANTPSVSAISTVLDIPIVNPPDEGGLLGFAFAPDFATSGQAYVSYTRNVTGPGVALQSVISRFTSADGGLTLNPSSEQEILVINHPFGNHNGGGINFGPDGYLYLGMGDGGSISDPGNNAQNTTNLLGTFIRIDVSGGVAGYDIPADNPFAQNPKCGLGSGSLPCPEIFAWGLRNPFRWSFDRDTGDLWAGDVGNLLREEVNIIQRNGNYGWRIREGNVCHNPNIPGTPLPSCDTSGLIDPIVDYVTGDLGRSVMGGYVYRGTTLEGLEGRYIFGDPYSSNIYTINDDGSGTVTIETLVANTNLFIAGFAESLDGENLYIVDLSGSINQLVLDTSSGNNTIPDSVLDTGCMGPAGQPASGLIPFEPGAAFWSDNAIKSRWLALPDGTSIGVDSDGDFEFPNGSVLIKNFERGGSLFETRLLMRHADDGSWAGYTYRWNPAETDATRIIGGATELAGGSDWVFPSESQCLQCHTDAAKRALGPEIAQLNNDLSYPTTGRTANQLATLDHILMLAPPAGDPGGLPSLPDPFGSAPLEDRARAYLHTNCSGCHRPGTPLQTNMDWRYDTPLAATNACNADPVTGGDLGISGAKLLVPGEPDDSLIRVRMGLRDANAMPPIGSLIPDSAGGALISEWIESLTGCT